jgi:hypothetical protein
MPYSVNSYANVGGSPFQQYENQQYQNYLQQQQAQTAQQNQQSQQQNPAFGGQQPNLGGGIQYGNQQNYGGWPPSGQQQYNPLPNYNLSQPQQQPPQNQGNSLQRGFGGVETPQNTQLMGMYQPTNSTSTQSNPYQTNPQSQPFQYSPLQQYNFGGGSPAGGTGNYSMFNYF